MPDVSHPCSFFAYEVVSEVVWELQAAWSEPCKERVIVRQDGLDGDVSYGADVRGCRSSDVHCLRLWD